MTPEDFSIIIVPDTQDVCTSHPDKLLRMTRWIVDHAAELNLQMVLHVGDVVNNGALKVEQYENHKAAFDLIDEAGIPMVIAIGNHDYDNILNDNRDTDMFNTYCGIHRFNGKPWFGGVFEEGKAENMYAKLEVSGLSILILSLEFGPRDEVLTWADEVLAAHRDHNAIVVTHSYLYVNGERTKPGDNHNPKNYKGAFGANDGEDVWNKCLKHHPNVRAVFSGHHITDNISFRSDEGTNGNLVFQSFQNWQCAPNGGDARIRILRFKPSEKRMHLNVFNPQTGETEALEHYETHHAF